MSFPHHRWSYLALTVSLALAGSSCADPDAELENTPSVESEAAAGDSNADESSASDIAASSAERQALRTPEQLDLLFADAARAFDVPAPILQAISYVETRFEMVSGDEEFEGVAPAHGLMALRGETLERGAALAEVSLDAARTDPMANLLAAAALLSSHADALGITDRDDLAAWAPAVAQFKGIADPIVLAHYIHDDIYATLRRGVTAHTPSGEIAVSLEPIDVQPRYDQPVSINAAGPDYAESIWRPSPNYNSRPSGSIGDPAMIVIHTCEGSYSGCWGWLNNPAAGVSAHYVVKEDGSEISQLVRESQRAWHVGATYQCSNNSGVDCWRNGYSSNHFTIGIEHGGYASQASFPVGQIDASAKLSCDISRDHDIPRDSFHIVAHGTLQPYNRTDPGPNWPWTDYLNRINSYCGSGGGGGGTIIVDSNNNNNNTAEGYISVSANWTGSANVSGYYGTGYWWASTQAISDGAEFWFYLPSAGTRTIDAWWSAAGDRSTSAPFIMYNASGTKLSTVFVNQQVNGGRWNELGTFNFTAGWNKVLLSRWTGAGSVVIADAIQIR